MGTCNDCVHNIDCEYLLNNPQAAFCRSYEREEEDDDGGSREEIARYSRL
jgi:hypothetical protein